MTVLIFFFQISGTIDNCSRLFQNFILIVCETVHCRQYHLPAVLTLRGHKVTGVNRLCMQRPPQGHQGDNDSLDWS